MRLAVPALWKGVKIVEAEIKRPDSGTLANTAKARKIQTEMHAMTEYISGSVISYTDSEGKDYTDIQSIKSITTGLPLQAAEQLSVKIMCLLYPEEYVQGIYTCPISGCNNKIKISKSNNNSVMFEDLEVVERDNSDIVFTLREKVVLSKKESGEIIIGGQSLVFSIPTVKQYIAGIQKYPGNEIYQYYEMVLSCLKLIDGIPIDANKIKAYGMSWIKKIDVGDIGDILKKINQGGIIKEIDIICSECTEEFKGPVELASFFA